MVLSNMLHTEALDMAAADKTSSRKRAADREECRKKGLV